MEKSIFAERRVAVKALMAKNSIVILSAAREFIRNRDSEYAFRQSSDLLYLTGFNEPKAVLVMGPDIPDQLFVRDRDPLEEIWTGRRLGPENVQSQLGIDQGHGIDDFESQINLLLDEVTTIEYPFNCNESVALVDKLIRNRKIQKRRSDTVTHRTDLTRNLGRLRMLKSVDEIKLMREAGRISAQGHLDAMRACRSGLTEDQLASIVEHRFRMEGSPALAYQTIVGGGENACILHYVARSDVLRDGDMVLIDAGCEVEGYAGDITRTFPVNGKFSETQANLYDVVLQAQKAAINEMRVGKTIKCFHDVAIRVLTEGLVDLGIIDGPCEKAIEEKLYLPYYMHGTGHFLGLDVHDVGHYGTDDDPAILEAGMVLTCEPGLYIGALSEAPEEYRGNGMRIEDNILIRDGEPEVLTYQIPKERAEIEAVMRDK